MNIDDARSYKSEDMLKAVIERNFPAGTKYMIVCNRKGRFTAVFGSSWNKDLQMLNIASFGFPVIG